MRRSLDLSGNGLRLPPSATAGAAIMPPAPIVFVAAGDPSILPVKRRAQ
jgi:hypothetical protein